MEAAPPGPAEQVGPRPIDHKRDEEDDGDGQDDLQDRPGTGNEVVANHRNEGERNVRGKDLEVALEQLQPRSGEDQALTGDLRAAPHVLAALGPGPGRVDAERDHGEEEVLEDQQEETAAGPVEGEAVSGRLVDRGSGRGGREVLHHALGDWRDAGGTPS
jgi:hypothetical protein